MYSVNAGLTRVGNVAPTHAYAWSAADVSAWFESSARWKQYQRHFAIYDGVALLTLNREAQLEMLGVLREHSAALLADLMALV